MKRALSATYDEQLLATAEANIRRNGRFLIAELLEPHRVLSTSVRNGGQTEHLRFLLNHQSCEGTDHREQYDVIMENGLDGYHDRICTDLRLDPAIVASMGTAANMNYAATVQSSDGPVTVTAIVTAGLQGNAACAGDPTSWRESQRGWERIPALDGTINTVLLLNHSLTEGALARAVVTMT